MIDLETEAREYGVDIRKKLDVRRGVFYRDLEQRHLDVFMPESSFRIVLAAIGPMMFYGRVDGPFVPYDRKLVDQNEERAVQDRQWPWCWGDRIWAMAFHDEQPLYLGWSKRDGCELYLAAPGRWKDLALAVRNLAAVETAPHPPAVLGDVAPDDFVKR